MNPAMREYYSKRAAEYDDWWLGAGLFEQRDRPGWYEDVSALIDVLLSLEPAKTLDLACGTGFLTRHLPGTVHGVDQSAEMIAIAAARCKDMTFEAGDALAARPGYERIFSSHFYGHLDDAQREAFLALPRDELVIVDSALRPDGRPELWQERVLDDGTSHSVYKRWFTGAGLADEIGGAEVLHDGPWFVAVRSSTPRS